MIKRNFLFSFLIFTALITATFIFKFEDDVVSTDSTIKWHEGENLHFEYSATNKINIFDPIQAEKSSATEQVFSGKLFIKIYQVKHDSIRSLAQFIPANEYFEEQKAEYNFSPVFELIFSPDGAIDNIIFSPTTKLRTQKKIKGLFDTINIKHKSGTKTWNSNETNSLGRYTAKYSYNQNGEIDKKILEYAELSDTSGYIEKVEVINSNINFKLSKENSWIQQLNSREELKLYRDNKAQIISYTDVELKHFPSNSSEKPIWADYSYDNALKQINSNIIFDPKLHLSEEQIVEKRKALVANLTQLKGPMKPYEILRTTAVIADDIKKHPQLIDELLNSLKLNEFNGDPGAHAIYALQKAGTDQAQEALTSIISSEQYHDYNKRRAIIALGNLSANSQTEEFLWRLYNSYDQIERKLYSESAAYSLGSIASHLRETDPTRSDNIIVRLSENLSESLETNNYDKSTILILSIGNSSRGDAAELLYPLLEADSDKLRESAAEALSTTDDGEGVIRLSERLLQEDSPSVRKKIVYSLNKREITQNSVLAIQQAVIEEEDEQLRADMAQYLLRASQHAKLNKDMIKEALALETNRKIYNSLSQILIN